jgi:hypothetical protein
MASIVFQRVNEEWQIVAFGGVLLTTRDVELGGLSAAALHVRLLKEQRIPEGEDVALGTGVTEEELRSGYDQLHRLELFERRAAQIKTDPTGALNE